MSAPVLVVPAPFVAVTDPWVLKLALKQLATLGGEGSSEYRIIAGAIDALQRADRTAPGQRAPNATKLRSISLDSAGGVLIDDASLLSVKGVARAAGVSTALVRRHALALDGHMVKFPNRKPEWRFPVASVDSWIASRKQRVA